jgi:hypothetical protein
MRRFFKPKTLIILAGLLMGVFAALLVKWGNPPNMGVCVACFMGVLVFKLILGQFHLGFEGQPVAHSSHLWNFLSMALVGLAATF